MAMRRECDDRARGRSDAEKSPGVVVWALWESAHGQLLVIGRLPVCLRLLRLHQRRELKLHCNLDMRRKTLSL